MASCSHAVVVSVVVVASPVVVVGFGFVDRRLARSCLRCPFTVAIDCGGYFLTRAEVSSGHVVNRPSSIALHHVERTGEKQHACR